MNCETCNADIPAAFVKAIQNNLCPACEGEIMSEPTRKLREDLRDAMAKMEGDPEGLSAWLLSTYDMKPKGEVVPTQFYHGKEQRNRPHQHHTDLPDSTAAAANMFLERANVNKLHRDPKFAAVAQALSAARKMNSDQSNQSEEDQLARLEEQEAAEVEAMGAQATNFSIEDLEAKTLIAKAAGRPLKASDLIANVANIGGDVSGGTAAPDIVNALEQGIFAADTVSMDGLDNHPLMQKRRMDKLLRQGSSGAKRISRVGDD